MSNKVAVVLSGCGYLDGAEIQESVLTLYFLQRAGLTYQCFAPNKPQMHVVDHRTGEPTAEARNVLIESARIARGAVEDLEGAKMNDFAALVIPGGFGVAKNLSDFAVKGVECSVDANLSRLIGEARAAQKPIVAICIAPAILAAALDSQDGGSDSPRATVTIGEDANTAKAIEKFGARHQNCPVDEAVVDEASQIITTPAYMLGPGPKDVGAGIEKAVNTLAGWLKS